MEKDEYIILSTLRSLSQRFLKVKGNYRQKTLLLWGTPSTPDFSPTKFFAGRDTGHEAVIIYRSLRYLQMLGNEAAADKSVGPKGELFDLKRKTPC
ncbi:MAG: hypothetical protein ACI8ZB_001292 [Desulforhopalus sp.]|jgi:hypothetical protein